MRRWIVVLVAAVVGGFLAEVAHAIANPSSWWSGVGTVYSSLDLGKEKETVSWTYSTGLYIDKLTLDFGSVSLSGVAGTTAIDFETGKTTNTRASTEKNPETARRQRNRDLAAVMVGLQKAFSAPPKKPLDHATIGDVTIDENSIKVTGGMTAIAGFTKVTGSITMKYAGTFTSGPRSGQTFKGKFKIVYKGNRA